jgi:arylsulfatase A-like enzyme
VEWKDTLSELRSERMAQLLRDLYDGCILHLDHELGLLFDELDRRGVLENTLVIVTSDHGETLREHGRIRGHASSLYLTELHVPLVVSFPGRVPEGRVVRAPVTLRDLPATVLDLARLADSASFPGRSLAALWAGDGAAPAEGSPVLSEASPMPGWTPKHVPIYKGDMFSLVRGGLHYIRNGDGSEELYDIEGDSLEQSDLAHAPDRRHALASFRALLDSVRGRGHGPRDQPQRLEIGSR